MMKLQKQIAYKYKGRVRYKYVIVISNETIEKLGWEAGEELENSVEEKKLILKPKSED